MNETASYPFHGEMVDQANVPVLYASKQAYASADASPRREMALCSQCWTIYTATCMCSGVRATFFMHCIMRSEVHDCSERIKHCNHFQGARR